VMNVMRVAGIVTVILIVGMILVLRKRSPNTTSATRESEISL